MNLHDLFTYNPESPTGLDCREPIEPRKGSGYWTYSLKGKLYAAHRVVYELHHGPIPSGMMIDHKDRDPMNNHIDNLRLATRGQNASNSISKRSLPKGVYSLGLSGGKVKYNGQISSQGRTFRYPTTTDLEAITAWSERIRLELYGEFT
ncbi:HNH endonuclease [Pseudomonas sp. MPFS]|nr:HNH endonuclease [Pseudomonas sp. MPFS]